MTTQVRASKITIETPEGKSERTLSNPATHHEPMEASLLSLQAQIGNEAVGRLLEQALQRAPTPALTTTTSGAAGATKSDAGSITTDAGVKRAADAGTALTLRRVGGDIGSKKVIRIGWTFDDGPSAVTPEMEAVANFPATWFIMRNQIGTGAQARAKYEWLRKKQAAGMEVGIHSMDLKRDHVAWFPHGGDNSYADIKTAMSDLAAFYEEVTAEKIVVHFARAPYGLHTEVMNYLGSLGVGQDLKTLARNLILGKATANGKDKKAIQQVIDDFEYMKASLKKLGLHEWAGKPGEDPGVAGWEGEDEPPAAGLTNDALSRFTGLVKATAADGGPHSMVLLAHDRELPTESGTSGFQRPAHASVDIGLMEERATTCGVRLEYYTMSELFKQVMGTAP